MLGLVAKPYAFAGFSGGGMTAFPSSNLANNDYGRVMRWQNPANSSNGVAFVFDLGSAKAVDVLALLWHNLADSDVIHYSGSNNPDGITNAIYDSGYIQARTGGTKRDVLNFWKNVCTLPAPVSARYWRIEMSAQPNAVISASRFFVGKGVKFDIGAQKATLGAIDLNSSITTEVGEVRNQEDAQLIRPVVALSFNYAKLSEMEEVLGQYTLGLGTSKPLLICTDVTSQYIQDNTAFGRPEKAMTHESEIYDVWSFEAVVTSIGP